MAAGTKKRAINPILAKELRLGSRSIKLPLAVMFYDLVLAVIAVIAIFIAAYANGSGTDYTGFLVIYQVIGWTQLGITLLIVPILTAGTISGEREKQTLEIMLTTPKKPLSIIWGKLLSALSNYMLFIIYSGRTELVRTTGIHCDDAGGCDICRKRRSILLQLL